MAQNARICKRASGNTVGNTRGNTGGNNAQKLWAVVACFAKNWAVKKTKRKSRKLTLNR